MPLPRAIRHCLLALLIATPAAAQQRPDTAQADTTRRQQPRQRQSSDENEQAEPRVDNLPLDPELRGFITLPGTSWRLRIGGYAKTDAMFDTRPAGAADLFVTSSIPTGDPPDGEGRSFNMHVRQTRLSIELRRPSSLGGNLRAYFEGDLYGPNGTTAPHLRHAYVQAANILVGQTFTTFMDVDALPDGVDFEGPGAASFLLVPQLRYTQPFGPRWSVAFAAEQPVADFTPPPLATPAIRFPDLIVRPRYEAPWGHLQFAAVLRGISYNDGQAGRNSTEGYGVLAAALLAVSRRDNVSLGAMWGRGTTHYMNDLVGLGMDAAVDTTGELEAVPAYGWYASLQHLMGRWRAVATTGWLRVEPLFTMPVTTTERTVYGSLAAIFSPRPTVDIGFSALYGEHRTADGAEGHAWRYQGGLQIYLVK